jgi:hypothetical protein
MLYRYGEGKVEPGEPGGLARMVVARIVETVGVYKKREGWICVI